MLKQELQTLKEGQMLKQVQHGVQGDVLGDVQHVVQGDVLQSFSFLFDDNFFRYFYG